MGKEDTSLKRENFVVETGFFDVGSGPELWYELWGNADSLSTPYVHFHGGPGAATREHAKDIFDPTLDLVLFFDQRGCGRSRSEAPRKHNTTRDTLDDARLLLKKLSITKVNARGWSFGSTLALLFAIENPDMVENVVIDGVFLADKKSTEHFSDGTIGLFFPEVWQRLLQSTPVSSRHDPIQYHLHQIQKHSDSSPDDRELLSSVVAMHNYEANLEELGHDFEFLDVDNLPKDFDPYSYAIFADYEANDSYLEEGYIVQKISTFGGHIYIVQGRFDMLCTMSEAVRLQHAAQHCVLAPVVTGHTPTDETRTELIQVVESLRGSDEKS